MWITQETYENTVRLLHEVRQLRREIARRRMGRRRKTEGGRRKTGRRPKTD